MPRTKRLSNEFIKKLSELAEGVLYSAEFDILFFLIEKEISLQFFTQSSEANLIRIFENQFDRTLFLKECITYPHHIELLVSLSSNSNYLTDILVRNPEYLSSITNLDKIKKPRKESEIKSLVQDSVNRFKTFEGKVNSLRILKRREFLRIGIIDIFLKDKLDRVTTELSLLAKSITNVLFVLCYEEILLKHKIEKLTNNFCLIALGKLGGNELNYSSDIDLIAFTNKNSLVQKRIYYNQIITETIQLFIEQASSLSAKGFLYRIDFRLRPDGRNSPLCGTITQFLQYYELRGEDWERQMLIKSGFICGNKNLFNRFNSYLEKFIYPASFDTSPLQQIKRLKTNIENKFSDSENIKFIPGGLRDIEFSVQALQLLNGGKNKSLRTGNSIAAITELKNLGFLSIKEADTFLFAYKLYRKIEHYLQLMNNSQVHTIPVSGELPDKISFHLGFKNLSEFRNTINNLRRNVSEIYQSITGVDKWEPVSAISKINFADKKRAQQNIEFLQYGKGILGSKKFDNSTTSLFINIQPDLVFYLSTSTMPDLVLENMSRIIRSASLPKIWYKEFTNKDFFNLFLRVCEYSKYAVNLFAEDKFLRDLYLTRKCFSKADSSSLIELNVKEVLFIIAVQYTTGLLSDKYVRTLLSDFISNKINSVISNFTKEKDWFENFLIFAMGSLGAKEISFKSDIDLIFVVDGVDKYPKVQIEFQEILSRLKKALFPFEVDCRLRPEGKSSNLVWDLNKYSEYLQNRARVWEFQAFLKSNFICGNRNYFNRLIKEFIERLKYFETIDLKTEMLEMRNRIVSSNHIPGSISIKKNPGGLVDLEFILSYYLLSDYQLVEKIIGGGTELWMNILSLKKEIKIDFKIIENNFSTLKRIELANQNLFDVRTARIPVENVKLDQLCIFLGYKNSNVFNKQLNENIQSTQFLFNQVLGNK